MMRRLVLLLFGVAVASLGQSSSSLAPLESWKAAVTSGDRQRLIALYSSAPPARVTLMDKGSPQLSADSDVEFWAGLRAKQISLAISQSNSPQPGVLQVGFEAEVKTASPPRTVYVVEAQLWQQQNGIWRLVAVTRTDARRLEQPLSSNRKIYPSGDDAREELHQALARAARGHKRVLVVFGADWCYDCHVLDRAFGRPDIAPLIRGNFELVHVDVGQGDKNQDLMSQYQVPMSRGIPALAVLESDGRLLYSQKQGEFERARSLGPEDLLKFLNQWKPQAR
jgi:thioredoxin 1